jgi:hypothetical protein
MVKTQQSELLTKQTSNKYIENGKINMILRCTAIMTKNVVT